MFVLVELEDTVRIPPRFFHVDLNTAIEQQLNRKLANKVVIDVGLCIAVFDITKIEESYIFPGDGASHTKVHFRCVVFRPFVDEILIGKLKSCSREGVHVSLEFFDDIMIPPDALQHSSRFDEAEQVWVWSYDTDDGKRDYFMDHGAQIRFRVVGETFVDTSPTGPATAEIPENAEKDKRIPYLLMGSISEPGLGLLAWWK